MNLTEFLLARIAEDEAEARDPFPSMSEAVVQWWDDGEDEDGFFAADQPDDVKGLTKTLLQIGHGRGFYARVLRECEAKRRIVDIHSGPDMWKSPDYHLCWDSMIANDECGTNRALAAVYADHPDYDPTWAPE